MKPRKSNHILAGAYSRLKKQNPKFSLRSLARKLGMSHVFLSRILKGKTAIPTQRIEDLIQALQLDDIAVSEFLNAHASENQWFTPSKQSPLGAQAQVASSPSESEVNSISGVFQEEAVKSETALDHWYELPMLDLLTCKDAPRTSKEFASRLGIPERQVDRALQRLIQAGLIREVEGRYQKASRYIRFPSKIPQQVLKNYYHQILLKGFAELEDRSRDAYDKRLITNFSVAIDTSRIAEAKLRIQKFLHELSLELSSGETSEVYFLTSLFFPVTKAKKP